MRTTELYDNLMRLEATNDAFSYIDHVLNETTYRVFSYRLASYTDFLLPDALESRGHMFRLGDDYVPELVSLPMEKFFNLNENPFTMDLDLSEISFIHDKRDGSLISTYMHDDKVCLKSKTAVSSDQALMANRILYSDAKLLDIVSEYVRQGMTVNFELTSPENRIVLPYQKHELRVLNVRNHYDLSYMPFDLLYNDFGEYMVDDYTDQIEDPVDFVASIPEMKGIEGFVIGLPDGKRIKIKTQEYLVLHRNKDTIMHDKNLFEAVLEGVTDDLRSLFHDDEFVLNRIEYMENIAGNAYNSVVKSAEDFHRDNNHLDRKSYAIKGQEDLSKLEFSLVMQLYSGKTPDYKAQVMKNHKKFLEKDSSTDYWSTE